MVRPTKIPGPSPNARSLSAEVTGDVVLELSDRLQAHWRSQEHSQSREERIRHLLDDGVLSMVFQPICTLDGKTVGAEAMARFECTPRQSPERWFAEARDAGLLPELEIAVARMALKALASLPRPLYLGINVSPATLADTAFRRMLEQSDGERVVLEIAEHALVGGETVRASLTALRARGTRLALGNAGAGLVSLRQILDLAPDFVKLDRALVRGIEADRSLQALAAGLIAFAHKTDTAIIAEGIQRRQEAEVLAELGVRFAQGSLFARPRQLPVQLGTPVGWACHAA
jgi:EAL domain-containing protein (putative c-di-GMP-specific phosphodiesterase class I)